MLDSIFKVKKMISKTCTQKVYSFAENNYIQSLKIIFEVLVIMLIIKISMRINTFKLITYISFTCTIFFRGIPII